jgi:ribosomal protein L7/L12
MSDIINLKIEGHGSFWLTPDMAHAIITMAKEAEKLAELAFPYAGYKMPLYLLDVGQKFIAVIKEYRSHTGFNLKDAKRACDKVKAGERLLLGRYTHAEAEKVAAPFREAGATVTPIPSPLELLAQQAE